MIKYLDVSSGTPPPKAKEQLKLSWGLSDKDKMTGKVTHKEKDITITHDISVDLCVADEIEKLNNEDNIFTLSSCCGHGHAGYIAVCGSDIQKMLKLGYDMTTLKYLDNDIVADDRTVVCAFKPKSKCSCCEKQ